MTETAMTETADTAPMEERPLDAPGAYQPVTDLPATDPPVPGTAHDEGQERELAELVGDIRIAMVATASPTGISSRPVTCVEATNEAVRFLVDRGAAWVAGLGGSGHANVSFVDQSANRYVSVCGLATVNPDPAAVQRLWNPAAQAFFDGPDDPAVAVLTVTVTEGEWWDGPSGKLRQAFALVRAAVTDNPDTVGDQGPVAT